MRVLLTAASLFVLQSLLSGCVTLLTSAANAPSAFGRYRVQRGIAYGPERGQELDIYIPKDVHTPKLEKVGSSDSLANLPAASSEISESTNSEAVKKRAATSEITPSVGELSPEASLSAVDAVSARPIVIFVHGGNWRNGNRRQYRFVGDALTSRGYAAVIPDYRLYPQVKFPGFVDDIALAVVWCRAHAAEIGGDPQRIFIMGHSAGAHIAAMIALDDSYLEKAGGARTWIKGFIGISGPYDFLPLRDPVLKEIFGPPSAFPNSQPINHVGDSPPPMLLMQGEADDVVWPRNSRNLAAKVREHGGKVEERYYPNLGHGGVLAGLTVYYRAGRPALDEIEEFISTVP